MFSLLKKWQRRQLAVLSNDKTQDKSSKPFWAQKPAEAFYNKMYPILRDNGVTNLENRKSWPINVVKQAMQELVKEMPSNIFRYIHDIYNLF